MRSDVPDSWMRLSERLHFGVNEALCKRTSATFEMNSALSNSNHRLEISDDAEIFICKNSHQEFLKNIWKLQEVFSGLSI